MKQQYFMMIFVILLIIFSGCITSGRWYEYRGVSTEILLISNSTEMDNSDENILILINKMKNLDIEIYEKKINSIRFISNSNWKNAIYIGRITFSTRSIFINSSLIRDNSLSCKVEGEIDNNSFPFNKEYEKDLISLGEKNDELIAIFNNIFDIEINDIEYKRNYRIINAD